VENKSKTLVIIMDILIAHHHELLSSEKKKLESIKSQDWVSLNQHIQRSKEILMSINNIEKERMEIVKIITGSKKSSFNKLLEIVPAGYIKKIIEKRDELTSVINEIKGLNKNIEDLLKSSLEVIDFSVSLFSGAGSNGKTYSPNGKEENVTTKHTSLLFDIKL